MKKILGLTVAAFMVMALVGGGTWAYFSDPEQSTGNLLSAGTLDLDINGGDIAVTLFTISDMYPGISGNASATLENSGTISGTLGIELSGITDTESIGGTEYEQDGAGGELGGQATIALFVDVDGDDNWSSGDIGLKNDANTYDHPIALDYQLITSYASDNWSDVYSGNMTSGVQNFYILYDIPTSADNTIQGDSCGFTIYFILKQVGMP